MKYAGKTLLVIACLFGLILPVPVSAAEQTVPHEVGGFVLGSDVNEYQNIMTSNFLKEMVVTDWHGFRKGVISYGVCRYPDKILKIDLKYEDESKEYFQKLLAEYKKRFGPPDEWKGDSFGILHIWKWYFTDSENRAVSLNLQHNLRNTNEAIGNVVKLTYPDMLEEERACFNQMCEERKSEQDRIDREQQKQPDWQYLIPR